ncbi:MAG: trigger factor [Clostridia bacterium]|nr:trigger factor [Clostridia bacterium]
MELKSSNKVDVNRWELEIFISPEEFNKEVDKIFDRKKKNISVPGFRKGKAPRKFIEKFYGEGIFYEDAINALYPDAIDNAAKKAGLELVDDHIDFELVKMSKEDGLTFKVKVTVMPEVTVENYKGIKVSKKPRICVSEKDIDEKIKAICEKNARLVSCEDGKAELKDIVNIDFKGFADGKAFEGGEAEGVDLELGSHQFIAGFEEQVVGHAVNDEFDVNVKFPKDYHAASLADKDAVFKVKLNKIQRKELPEFDDEFVKDVSEFENVKDYRSNLKKEISESKKVEAENKIENETIDKFIELVKADIPDALIKGKVRELVRDFEYKLKAQGLDLKNYLKYTGTNEEYLENTFRPQAINHVKLSLGLKKVAELENIEVTPEDIENEYKKIADGYKMKPEQVKKFIAEDDIKKDISSSKALKIIKENRVEE